MYIFSLTLIKINIIEADNNVIAAVLLAWVTIVNPAMKISKDLPNFREVLIEGTGDMASRFSLSSIKQAPMKCLYLVRYTLIVLTTVTLASCSKNAEDMHTIIPLNNNWYVQTSDKLAGLKGAFLSSGDVNTSTWFPATVPSTIMAVLTGNGLYPDLFVADSMKKVDTLQFERPWWYLTRFVLPDLEEEQRLMLCFDGISYYANVWLNGTLVAGRDKVFGTFRRFEFDITGLIKDSENILAIEVFKQKRGDFGHGFVDWNPAPPDDNMGIWRGVYIEITGDVALKNTFISSDVNTESLNEASLTITTDLINHTSRSVHGKLIAKGDGIEFEYPVHLKGDERRSITLTSDEIGALKIAYPRLWWCNNMGEPNLYNISLKFISNKAVSDEENITFGIRKIETYMNEKGHRGFKLNGKEVLIKGAGWTDDIFLRDNDSTNEIQVRYVKHMNLNTIRFENIWGSSRNVYSLCDSLGIMAMVGWSCQWEWENYLGKRCDEYGGIRTKKDMDLAVAYLNDQIRYLQNHPSIFVWMLGSDMLPRPALEKRYRQLIDSIDNRPYVAAASKRTSTISGPTGVKMNGPYNYVGPSYWYIDSVNGGAYGFNTETGPGPQIPVMETIERMLPEEDRWPINDMWNYHCNPSQSFGNLSIFNASLTGRYGQATNLGNYLKKADVQGYEAIKGMFESFRANRPNTTGIIQWMLNSAWPSFYWQLYDYYFIPTAAYYGVKKANEPVQLIYNYANRRLYIANSTLNSYDKLRASVVIADLQGGVVFSDEMVLNIDENTSEPIYRIPPVYNTSFLVLTLRDQNNRVIADNTYWLAGNPDVYDWEKTEWFYTPLKSRANFTALNYMPLASIELSRQYVASDRESAIETHVTNTSDRIAFFVNVSLRDSSNKTVVPVFWEDNYITLLPGESRQVKCRLYRPLKPEQQYKLIISGWNVNEFGLVIDR